MEIFRKHEALFQGTGNLIGMEVKLEIDKTVQPAFAQPARRIAQSMTGKLNYVSLLPSPRKLVM